MRSYRINYFVIFLPGVLSIADHALPKCEPDSCPPAAECKEADGYIYCDCPKGKVGLNCTEDDPCLPNLNCAQGYLCYGPCDPNIVCNGATGLPHCRGCVSGYTGLKCLDDVDECTEFPDICANNGTCKNLFGDFKCHCTEEWTGKECLCKKGTACDIDEIIDSDDDGRDETTTPSGAASTTSVFLLKTLILVSWCLRLT